MMTNKKISSKTKSGLLALIPVSAFLLILTGSVNGSLARGTKDYNLNNQATLQNVSEVPGNNLIDPEETLTDTVKNKQSAKVFFRENPDDTVKTTHQEWKDVKVVGYANQKKDTISIVSKDKSEENTKLAFRNADGGSSKVLWLVDGNKVPDISRINPENIQKIEVIKDENIKKYTSEDYDGVMIVTMKKEGVKNEENNKLSVRRADDKTSKERLLNDENGNRDNTVEDFFGEVKIKGESSKVLYIVDGEEVTDISGINPDKIQSIEVKKNENIRKYKDYDGVIIVTMKKKGVNE